NPGNYVWRHVGDTLETAIACLSPPDRYRISPAEALGAVGLPALRDIRPRQCHSEPGCIAASTQDPHHIFGAARRLHRLYPLAPQEVRRVRRRFFPVFVGTNDTLLSLAPFCGAAQSRDCQTGELPYVAALVRDPPA